MYAGLPTRPYPMGQSILDAPVSFNTEFDIQVWAQACALVCVCLTLNEPAKRDLFFLPLIMIAVTI